MNGSEAPLRVGIIGCGRMAERAYAPAIASSEGLTLAAVADPDADRAALVASLGSKGGPRPAAHATAAGMVGAGGLDAVVVASPAECHLEGAEAAADAGLPALVEKPPADDAGAAERIAALDPQPLIDFNRRIMLGEAIRGAVPGAGPCSIEAEISYRRASWDPVAVRDSALADLGPHLIDLVTWLAGEPTVAVTPVADEPERAEAEVRTERATCRIACATNSPHHERVAVRGPGGELLAERRIGGHPAAAILARLTRRPHPLSSAVARQLEDLAAHLRGGGRGTLATAAEGAAVMRALEAAA